VERLRELFPDVIFKHDWEEIDAHLGTRIKIGQRGDARADFCIEPRFARAEENAPQPRRPAGAAVDFAELLEFGFNLVGQKLLGARGKLNRFFVILAPTGEREIIEEPFGYRDERIGKIMTMPERMHDTGAVAWVSAMHLGSALPIEIYDHP
jgi:hypothetical protein